MHYINESNAGLSGDPIVHLAAFRIILSLSGDREPVASHRANGQCRMR